MNPARQVGLPVGFKDGSGLGEFVEGSIVGRKVRGALGRNGGFEGIDVGVVVGIELVGDKVIGFSVDGV